MLRNFLARGAARAVLRADSDRAEPYKAVPSHVDALSDADLQALNEMLPWAAYTLDAGGRRFGRAFSKKKRAQPQAIPDPRINELDRRLPLRGLQVLEVGCFEGIHTVALARCGAQVLGVDSRIENVAKTAVRCALYGVAAQARLWDAEGPTPADLSLDCDVLHHVGVLYHLTDPVGHLAELLPRVRTHVMLDTHVAPSGADKHTYEVRGKSWTYHPYLEGGRADPFSGMRDHAKWLPEASLLELLASAGFPDADVQRRDERNGPRVLIHARRKGAA